VLRQKYRREYGKATIEIPADGLDLRGRNVVIIDDVLATGGTIGAATRLLERTGANVTAAAVVVELTALGGREAIAPLPLHSLSRAA
jgi:adenine phosphoribosyltransferase